MYFWFVDIMGWGRGGAEVGNSNIIDIANFHGTVLIATALVNIPFSEWG